MSKRREVGLPAIFGYDFFVSFKLGKPPDGAQSYASDLARGLRELDYTVFFSEEEAPPGAKLDATLMKALWRSRILVVIANSGALLESHWVRKEVEAFRDKHPARPVVVINVDHAIERDGPRVNAATWLGHAERIWLDETEQAVRDGLVSPELLKRLAITPRFLRATVRLRWLVGVIILSLVSLTGYAWAKQRESHQRFVAYNLAQGRTALTNGRALEAAPSLLRARKEGADTPEVRFMLARALASVDALVATFDGNAWAFSPEGDRFAVALANGTIDVWGIPERKIIATLRSKLPSARALTFSPDGRSLVVASGETAEDLLGGPCLPGSAADTVSVWDVRTGGMLHDVDPLPGGMGEGCLKAFFSGNGTTPVIAGWSTSRADLYWWLTTFSPSAHEAISTTRADDNRRCQRLSVGALGDDSSSACPGKVVAISPDGALMAIAPWGMPQRELTLWNVQQGGGTALPLGHDTEITGADFSSDNERVAITRLGGVEIWDVRPPRRRSSIPLATAWIPSVFSPDGTRLAAVTEERTVVVLDVASGRRVALLAGHSGSISVVRFSPDGGRILTAGDDALLKLWDGWTGRLLLTLEGHAGPVIQAEFSPDDRFIVSRDQTGRLKLWDAWTAALPRALRNEPARIRWWSGVPLEMAGGSPDGERVLLKHLEGTGSGSDGEEEEAVFTLWNTRAGTLEGLWRTAVPPALWPGTHAPKKVETSVSSPCPAKSKGQQTLAVDTTRQRVVSLVQDAVVVQSKAGGCRAIPLQGATSAVTSAVFSPEGDFVQAVDASGEVRAWNAGTGELLAVLTGGSEPGDIMYFPGSRVLTLDAHLTAMVWDVSSEERPLQELQRLLMCSTNDPADALGDLVLEEGAGCAPAIPEHHSGTPSAAARAFLVSGWGRRQDPAWAESRLLAASALYKKANDPYGEAVSTLALRGVLRLAGDAAGAEARTETLRARVKDLNAREDQRDRLTRLGELAFNEFGDTELARFVFAQVLQRAPQDLDAMLGAWETSLLKSGLKARPDTQQRSMRFIVLDWVAMKLANEPTDETALEIWTLYFEGRYRRYERLDFRGLRREIEAARLPKKTKRSLLGVLETMELSGDHGTELRRWLAIPDDAEIIGP